MLVFVFLVSLVTYLDRVNIAIAGRSLKSEFGLSGIQLGKIFSAFGLGYALFQIPGGWWGDRFGHKKVLVLALVWWSIFTSLTAFAGNRWVVSLLGLVPAFCLFRFSIGVGEAATFPCAGGLISLWFPPRQRAFASGVLLAGVGVGSATTPPFVAWVMLRWGWRSAFYICSAIGIILAIGLRFRVRMPSEESADPTGFPTRSGDAGQQAESLGGAQPIQVGGETGWLEILRQRDVWILTISDFFHAYIAYIYFFWFYTYLVEIRGFSLLRGSFFATLPFLAMAIGSPLGGWLCDRLMASLGKTRARRHTATGGLILSSLLMSIGAGLDSAYWAITCLALAAGLLYFTLSCYWAAAMEIVPPRSATVCGIMNTGANLGGAISPLLTVWIAERYGWMAALDVAAAFGLIAALLWKFVGSVP